MKHFLKLIVAVTTLSLAASASAQESAWPSKPVTLIVPFSPGGITDNTGRLLAKKLGEQLGQTVLVDNRPGAGGSLGVDVAARAAPDGYTIVMGTSGTHAANLALFKTVRYDPLTDFVPIHGLLESPLMLVVNASLPYKTVAELVAFGKANPGKLTFASAGPGTGTHLTAAQFESVVGIKMTHVPYKGSSPALADLIAGRTDLMFDYAAVVTPQIQAGKLRPLAVTSTQRLTLAPDVLTMAELGYPDASLSAWTAIFAPAKTPPAVVKRLSDAMAAALVDPELDAFVSKFGSVSMVGMRDAKLDAFLKNELVRWREVVKSSGAAVN